MTLPSQEAMARSSAQFNVPVPRSSSLSPSKVLQSVTKSVKVPVYALTAVLIVVQVVWA